MLIVFITTIILIIVIAFLFLGEHIYYACIALYIKDYAEHHANKKETNKSAAYKIANHCSSLEFKTHITKFISKSDVSNILNVLLTDTTNLDSSYVVEALPNLIECNLDAFEKIEHAYINYKGYQNKSKMILNLISYIRDMKVSKKMLFKEICKQEDVYYKNAVADILKDDPEISKLIILL